MASGDSEHLTLASALSDGVWQVLRSVRRGRHSKKLMKMDLDVNEAAIQRNVDNRRGLENELFRTILGAYKGINYKKLTSSVDDLHAKAVKILQKYPPHEAKSDPSKPEVELDASIPEVKKTYIISKEASEAVWEIIKHLFPDGVTWAQLDVDDDTLLNFQPKGKESALLGLVDLLNKKVPEAYDDSSDDNQLDLREQLARMKRHNNINSLSTTIAPAVWKMIDEHTSLQINSSIEDNPTALAESLAAAFSAPYHGTADVKFEQHLVRCCQQYHKRRFAYVAPNMTITQSSGFGKSRIVRQLGKKLEDQPSSSISNMRLLYICGRDIPRSTGFPVATPELFEFVFPSKCTAEIIAERLRRAFDYACTHWNSVQSEWNGVFGTDGAAMSKVLAPKLLLDGDFSPAAKNVPHNDPTLVVVIDEARSLLTKDTEKVDYFRLLRRALTLAKAKLRVDYPGKEPLIFAVVVDTNSQIYDFVPPLSMDSSSRGDPNTRLFPPFVLTQTMDVFLKYRSTDVSVPVSFSYMQCVLESNPSKVRELLLAMGRPLWHSKFKTDLSSGELNKLKSVLRLGGLKLLCGLPSTDEKNYKNETLHGVAALMCRLGLRPQSTSAFASEVVANFMAVLHAVKYMHDAHISGYISEPFLTFAATHMWYAHHPRSLTQHMLPQFRSLLLQGMIDVGSIGEVVTRIFLLLAMDATIANNEEGNAAGVEGFDLESGNHHFEGQFCSVPQFLAELDGTAASTSEEAALLRVTIESKEIAVKKRKLNANDTSTKKIQVTKYNEATPEEITKFKSWMENWDDWKVGFSHFVELDQVPTEAALWCMLARRAAGVFPRGQAGADLIIPIFCRAPDDVSYMLVQVQNEYGPDNKFPHSALGDMDPSSVFGSQSTNKKLSYLSEFSSNGIIRVLIALRDSHGEAQSYLIDETGRGENGSYTMCLRGICKEVVSTKQCKQVKPHAHWPFLSNGIWEELEELAVMTGCDPMKALRLQCVGGKVETKQNKN